MTLRGHTAAITSVAISNALSIIFSASLDSTIRLWQLPAHNHDPYATYNPSVAVQTLEGHTESVWDICLLPPQEVSPAGKEGIEGRLVSASSDGSVKLWERSGSSPSASNWKLEKSFSSFGEGVIPTCLAVFNLDFGKVLVGTSDGKARLWDVDAGEEVRLFGEEGQGVDSQVNAILSHPTLPAIVTAHEDGYLRFYDAKSCEWHVFISLCRDMSNNRNSIHYPDAYSPRSSRTYNFSCSITLIPNVHTHVVCRLYCSFVGLDKEDFNPGIGRAQRKGR